MAFTPTAADFGPEEEFHPTLADFGAAAAPHQLAPYGTSGLGRAVSTLADFGRGIHNVGGDIFNVAADLPNWLLHTHVHTPPGYQLPLELPHARLSRIAAKTGKVAGLVGADIALGPELLAEEGLGLASREAVQAGKVVKRYLPSAAHFIRHAFFGAAGMPEAPLTGAAAGVALSKLPGVAKYVAGLPEKYSVKGLSKQLPEILKNATHATNHAAFSAGEQNLGRYENSERGAWNQADALAAHADQSIPQGDFDNSSYVQSLENQLAKLKTQSAKQSSFSRANKEAEELLEGRPKVGLHDEVPGYIQDAHNTYANALEHNQALNHDFAMTQVIDKGVSRPRTEKEFSVVKEAKSALHNMINENLEKHNLKDTLGKVWKSARQITGDKNKIFNKIITPAGKETGSRFNRLHNLGDIGVDQSTFIKDYLPTTQGEGIQKMQQFAKLIGSKPQAAEHLKMNIFKDSIKGDDIDPKSFLSSFNKLSSPQKEFLFKPEELNLLKTLSAFARTHPSELNKPSSALWGSLHHGVSALMGGALATHLGESGYMGAIGGLMAAKGAKAGMRKLMGTSAMRNYLIKKSTEEAPKASAIGDILRRGGALTPLLADQRNQQ